MSRPRLRFETIRDWCCRELQARTGAKAPVFVYGSLVREGWADASSDRLFLLAGLLDDASVQGQDDENFHSIDKTNVIPMRVLYRILFMRCASRRTE
jgi:hypothetical protein